MPGIRSYVHAEAYKLTYVRQYSVLSENRSKDSIPIAMDSVSTATCVGHPRYLIMMSIYFITVGSYVATSYVANSDFTSDLTVIFKLCTD